MNIKEYYNILCSDYPKWLDEYINTKEMQRLKYISVSCGQYYSKLFNINYYSSLDHSIGVALIIWNFTHDKKQTLSGLFHDISTPVFKHTIDYLNKDYLKQESTEEYTRKIIENSKEIMSLLKKDNISIDDVYNYHIYPIADNDTPKLSSDRLEYSLSNGLFVYNKISINDVKKIYNDISIKIIDGVEELGFNNKDIAIKFVNITSKLSILYRDNKTRYSMQLLADIVYCLNKDNIVTIDDLYKLKESDIINIINNSRLSNTFKIWSNSKRLYSRKIKPNNDIYYVNIKSKIRYIDPLVNNKRISSISKRAYNYINKNKNYDMDNYLYIKSIKRFNN